MVTRSTNLSTAQSFFLCGPRGTGKSTLFKEHFQGRAHFYVDLLRPETEARLAARPERLLDDWAGQFYMFDIGVTRAVAQDLRSEPGPGTYEYGRLFEHFIILEVIRLNDYSESGFRLSDLRTKDDAEVDLVIERSKRDLVFVEIKSGRDVVVSDIKKLAALVQDVPGTKGYIMCQTPTAFERFGIRVLPWRQGLLELFAINC